MKVGDLVEKINGYGYNQGWTGIILGFHPPREGQIGRRIQVLTEEGIEDWHIKMVKVIQKA